MVEFVLYKLQTQVTDSGLTSQTTSTVRTHYQRSPGKTSPVQTGTQKLQFRGLTSSLLKVHLWTHFVMD